MHEAPKTRVSSLLRRRDRHRVGSRKEWAIPIFSDCCSNSPIRTVQ